MSKLKLKLWVEDNRRSAIDFLSAMLGWSEGEETEAKDSWDVSEIVDALDGLVIDVVEI